MTLKQLLNAPINDKEAQKELQRWLIRIPQLKSRTPEGERVNLEHIEILIYKLCEKHNIRMQWITPQVINTDLAKVIYSFSFKKLPEHEWYYTAYGRTIYEVYAKAALYLYASLERGDQ